jgi:hypothetical protein
MPGGIDGVYSYMRTSYDRDAPWRKHPWLDDYNVLLGPGLPFLLFDHNESHRQNRVFPTMSRILDDQQM